MSEDLYMDKINISFDVNLVSEDEKSQYIADSFGLGYANQHFDIYKDFELDLSKQIYYITGDSGSGKSLLLKYVKEKYEGEYVDYDNLEIDEDELLYKVKNDLKESLKYLTLIGLGDAFLFLNKYKNLSDGQKARYRLLKCLLSGKKIIIIDEFLATLDRESAFVVAFNIQRILRREFTDVKLFVATTHTDIEPYIFADVIVKKLFGSRVSVYQEEERNRGYNPFRPHCTIKFDKEEGKRLWKEVFSQFHYRSHVIPFLKDICMLYLHDEPIGIITLKYATNKKCQTARISRVVILPKYRGAGLATWFVREASKMFLENNEDMIGVDTVAVMANFNPFFEKAGFEKIEYEPVKIAEDIRKYIEEQGANFFKFRVDVEYAWYYIDEYLETQLKKIYVKKKRMYGKFKEENLPDFTKDNLAVYLAGTLEVLYPLKYIMKGVDYETRQENKPPDKKTKVV